MEQVAEALQQGGDKLEISVIPLAATVLLSIVLERVLAVIFDMRAVNDRLKVQGTSFKGVIAAGIGIAICLSTGLDAVNPLIASAVSEPLPYPLGQLMTGALIAGGSQGSVKLFQDVLGFAKSNRDTVKVTNQKKQEALQAEAESRRAAAEVERARKEYELMSLTAARPMGSLAGGGGPLDEIAIPAGRGLSLSNAARDALLKAVPDRVEQHEFAVRWRKARRDRDERVAYLKEHGPDLSGEAAHAARSTLEAKGES